MATYTKTQFKKRIEELKEKLSDLRMEFEELQSDLESESSDIEPYENRDELTPLQEERQEWLDNTASTVEDFFEKENIYTFDSKGEMILTLMSSLAQEESRSISENVTWVEQIKNAFVKAYNQFAIKQDEVIERCVKIYERLAADSSLDEQIEEQRNILEGLNLMAKQLIDENASTEQDQDSYKRKYAKLEAQFKSAEEKFNELQKRKSIAEAQAKSFMVFIETFKKLPKEIIEWDYRIWNFSIDHATINKDKSIDFLFKNGQNIRVELKK